MSEKRVPIKKNEAPTLTLKAIKAAEPREKDYWMAGEGGLFLRIYPRHPNGKQPAKTYYHIWSEKGSANKNRVKLGNHIDDEKNRTKSGQLTLAQALKRNRETIDLLDRGLDPRNRPVEAEGEKDSGKEIIKHWHNMTVADLAEAYLAFTGNPLNRAPKTHEVYKQVIDAYVLPAWGKLRVASIKRSDARNLILKLKDTPKKYPSFENETITGAANQVLKTCRTMFYFQIQKEDPMPTNPFWKIDADIEIAPVKNVKKTERALKNKEITQLWHTLSSNEGWGSNASRRALLLCLVTGQRPGEVAGMHRKEIDDCWWQIPFSRIKTRHKNKRDHRVYLSPLALRIIGEHDGYIFPSPSPKYIGKPIIEDTLNKLVNKEVVKKGPKSGGVSEIIQPEWLGLNDAWTPHDLRKTVSTGLASIGCTQEFIDKILNHQLEGARARYNLCHYDPQKEEWQTKWSKHLEKLVGSSAYEIPQSEEPYDVEKLRELVQRYPLEKVGEILGVTGNAIKKRCLKHGIEHYSRGYWQKPENRDYVLPGENIKPAGEVDDGFVVRKILWPE